MRRRCYECDRNGEAGWNYCITWRSNCNQPGKSTAGTWGEADWHGLCCNRKAENRDAFEKLLSELSIPQPKGQAVTNIEDGVKAAEEIGYPVLVRPSFVLGGRAMQIVAKEEHLRHYLKTAVEIDEDKPVLVDKYICGKEVEIDAICDGTDVFVPGIMELVERTGVHSGDSISVYPTFSISDKVKATILDYAKN